MWIDQFKLKNRLIHSLIVISFLSSVVAEEKKSAWSFQNLKKAVLNTTEDAIYGIVDEGGANNLFYLPINFSDTLPSDHGYKFKNVEIVSKGEIKLHGWVIHTPKEVIKGVIVFSHGNTGSVNNHFGFCSWLLKEGYDVLMFDYRGYGKSEGEPERQGLVDDVIASIDYAGNQKEWAKLPIISFAHSLGVAKTVVALDQMKQKARVKAAIFWAGFSSYVKMAEEIVGNRADEIVTNELSPIDHLDKLKTIPKLFVHGKKDKVIPFSHSEEMYERSNGSKKLMLSDDGGHNNALWKNDKKLQKQIIAWLEKNL